MSHKVNVGIVIYDSTYWGKGIGFEALGLWTDYLFSSQPNIIRVHLWTWSGNPGMMRLAEKLGFVREACLRKEVRYREDGKYYDTLIYSTLREEWTE